MSSHSPALQAVQAHFDALGRADLDALRETLTVDAVRHIYPTHMKVPVSNSREEIVKIMSGSFDVLRDAKLEVNDTCMQTMQSNKVWARATVTATLINGDPYHHERVYMLEAAQDSDGVYRLSKLAEIVDVTASQQVLDLRPPLN